MKFKRIQQPLTEQTYGLTEKPLTLDAMLNVALGWRMLDILTSSTKELPQGFSIRSNLRGQNGENPDKILHHIFGNWKFEDTTELSVKEHTTLHNKIRNIIKKELVNLSNIKDAYNEYVEAYKEPLSYETIGNRFRAYEEFFRRIANSLALTTFTDKVKSVYETTLNSTTKSNEIKK